MNDSAAERRGDYVRALTEERDGYARAGRDDRAAEVDAELARVVGTPAGRSATPVETVDAAPAKPARQRKRG